MYISKFVWGEMRGFKWGGGGNTHLLHTLDDYGQIIYILFLYFSRDKHHAHLV